MLVTVSTKLKAPAAAVWEAIKRSSTLVHVTRGAMGFRSAEPLPAEWRVGERCRFRLFFFHLLPAWLHEIKVVSVDDDRRELKTEERGGPVRRWDHSLRVEAVDESWSRYTDAIEIEAGWLTPAVWLFAHLFYRYRQRRWRSFARRLVTADPSDFSQTVRTPDIVSVRSQLSGTRFGPG